MDGRVRGLTAIASIMLLLAEVAFLPTSAAASTLPKPKHTNKTRFRIPFKFDSTALQRMNAREIQLHVSQNHGESWELAQTLTPEGGRFEYHAPGEGEFWFAVKTLDGRNQLHPQRGAYETGLIVVVDNTDPILELSLKPLEGGQVQLVWKAADRNLDVSTLRIEYQTGGANDWEVLPVPQRSSGEHIWAVNQSGLLMVRGSVSDLAENQGQSTTHINVAATGAQNEKPRSTTRRPPIAMPDERPGAQDSQGQGGLAGVDTNGPNSADGVPQLPIITPRGSLPVYTPARQRLVSNSTAQPAAEPSHQPFSAMPVVPPAVPNEPVRELTLPAVPVATSTPLPTPTLPVVQAPQQPAAAPAQPPNQRSSLARHRIVRNREFQIGYKLGDVGPSGISGVELFVTEDNGRVWWKYDDDPDQKSPFDVKVYRDGTFGFAIRARSGAGLSIDPPVPGQPPEIVVTVDQTPPIVNLFPIQQGQGLSANRLLIRWKIAEEHPAEKPVSLQYAASQNGPWETFCGWRDDTNSSYEWTVGPTVPSQFYLRVLVRDHAGNIGQAETTMPIVVDMQRPTARIVDVEVPPTTGPQ